MRQTIIVFVLLTVAFSSCVTNSKYLLLQKKDLGKKDLPKDSVVRTYNLDEFGYKIQTHDLISVRYQSLTAKEFDFLSQSQANQQNLQMQQNGSPNGSPNVQGSPLLIGELVDQNGEIPIPVVGKVKVAGLTLFEIQDKLQKLADQYLESPVVKVRLLNYRATLIGEVNKEGSITFNNNRVSLLEMIGLAGGLSDLADKANIKVIRQTGSKTEVAYVNLLDENFMNSPYYYVYQNDIIVVPPLKQRPYRKYLGQNVSIILSAVSVVLFIFTYTKK